MERPNEPSVPPSEPEAERRIVEGVLNSAKNGKFDGILIHLPFVREYLQEMGLDVDSDGFIIDAETGEYSVPYTFVDELVQEYVKDEDESVFDAFFRPVTHDRVYGWDNKRLHLSDLHTVIKTEDGAHPVRDDSFDIAEFHATLETGFSVMMGWSDIVKKENITENGQWLAFAKESDSELELNCLNPNCNYSGSPTSWDGDEHIEPECPDCGGKWDSDGITVCTICEHWYWGTHFAGESVYAEPACANCGEDMEYLERVHRYDNVTSFEELVESTRPNYTVEGLDDENNVQYVFDHTETEEEAVEQKELGEDISGGSAFENVESVRIRERAEVGEVDYHERTDDQA